jgi:uncharacterized protein with PQ loop repeat
MTFILPNINTQRIKDIACSAAYILIIALCLFIAFEAITIQTVNTTLLRALTALLPLI